jgi:phosphatidylserine decarboxylase
MAKESIPYIILFAVPTIIFAALGWWIAAILCGLLAAFMAFFFRDPKRDCPVDDTLIISPADGRVVVVAPVEPGRTDSPTQISIFLSPMDVHINRSPIAGEITEAVYKKGAFHVASRDIASVENEQNILTIQGRLVTIGVRQIAGVLARRVVLWKKQGDHVQLGERIGLMKFSSRMDVIVPHEVQVLVRQGERVVAGITVLARVQCD